MMDKAADIVAMGFVLVAAGTVLLRLSGKKSVSELTLASTVVLFMLGEILSAPLMSDSIWETVLAIAACLATLMLLELLQFKLSWLRRLLTGGPMRLIEEGRIVEANLRKLRMSTEELAMRLREQNAQRVKDVLTATMETNGKVTVELKPHAKPVTVGDLEKLLARWSAGPQTNVPSAPAAPSAPPVPPVPAPSAPAVPSALAVPSAPDGEEGMKP
jgi:uncharacterized membrane protein YcaP (DUF421 family)